MRLTCCCGASIEWDNDDVDERVRADDFQNRHACCPGKRIFVPMYTVHCDSSGQEMFRRCTTCGGIIKPPSIPYHKGMTLCGCEKIRVTLPIDHELVQKLCRRDGICGQCGGALTFHDYVVGSSLITCTCKPDPYQRFRDAIREGKRVWYDQHGIMSAVCYTPLDFSILKSLDASRLFIEGVDIPVQPTQEWLDRKHRKLTGECRHPLNGEEWQGLPGGADGCLCNTENARVGHIGIGFSGRRWIVRKKAVNQPAENLFGPMDEFTIKHCPVDGCLPGICRRCHLRDAKSRYFCAECLEEIKVLGLSAITGCYHDYCIHKHMRPFVKGDSFKYDSTCVECIADTHRAAQGYWGRSYIDRPEVKAAQHELNRQTRESVDLAAHAAAHDAIVRKKLHGLIGLAIPPGITYGPLRPVPEAMGDSTYVALGTNGDNLILCDHHRAVDLSIGQSAAQLVKQARDLVTGMGITKKAKYCAFNIVGSTLIWGIK